MSDRLSLKRLAAMLEALKTSLNLSNTTMKSVTLESASLGSIASLSFSNPTALSGALASTDSYLGLSSAGALVVTSSGGSVVGDISASGDIYGSNLYINAVGQNVVQVSNTGDTLSKWEWHRNGTRKWVIYNDGRTSPSIYTDALVFKHGTASDADATHINMALSPNDQDVKFYGHITASGDIILDDGGSLKEAGGTAALTFDGSGHVTKIGQDSPSSNDVLTWDGSKAVWQTVSTAAKFILTLVGWGNCYEQDEYYARDPYDTRNDTWDYKIADLSAASYVTPGRSANFTATSACKVTKLRGWVHASHAESVEINIWKTTPSDASNANVEYTQIGSTSSPSATTANRIYSLSTTYSSGNTLSAGDVLLLTIRKTSGGDTNDAIYFNISLEIEYT